MAIDESISFEPLLKNLYRYGRIRRIDTSIRKRCAKILCGDYILNKIEYSINAQKMYHVIKIIR